MITRKKIITLGISTYSLSVLLLILYNYSIYIIIPEIKNWEAFSYSFYGGFIFYGFGMILYAILMLIIDYKKMKNLSTLILMLLLLEISVLLFLKESITITIVKSFLKENDNEYQFIIFPIVIIVSYFIFKKVLRISFK